MGFSYRKRIRLGKAGAINLSKSGVSLSSRLGPVTYNTRGRVTTNLPGGMVHTANLATSKSKRKKSAKAASPMGIAASGAIQGTPTSAVSKQAAAASLPRPRKRSRVRGFFSFVLKAAFWLVVVTVVLAVLVAIV